MRGLRGVDNMTPSGAPGEGDVEDALDVDDADVYVVDKLGDQQRREQTRLPSAAPAGDDPFDDEQASYAEPEREPNPPARGERGDDDEQPE